MDTAGRRYTFPFKSKIYKKNCTPPFMNYKLVWQIQYNTKQTALSTSERIFLKLNNGGEIGTISSGLLFPPKKQRVSRCFFGGDNEIRTRGLCVANAALYQLSHIPTAMNLEIQAHRFHCAPKKMKYFLGGRGATCARICSPEKGSQKRLQSKIFWEEERQADKGCETPRGGSLKTPLCRDVVGTTGLEPVTSRM